MTNMTVADIINHAEQFEQMLCDYYENIASVSTCEGVRLLAEYMSRHRKRIRTFLGKLPEAEVQRLKQIPLPYEPQVANCDCFAGVELGPDAQASQVLDAAVDLDQCLIRLYRLAADAAEDKQARKLFQKLLESEERDRAQLKTIKAMDYF